jgi:hypothetical protein
VLSGVLLRESPGRGPVGASEAARYQLVVNVARHYPRSVVPDDGADGGAVACDSEAWLFLGADSAGLSGVRVTEMEGPGDGSRFGQAGDVTAMFILRTVQSRRRYPTFSTACGSQFRSGAADDGMRSWPDQGLFDGSSGESQSCRKLTINLSLGDKVGQAFTC